MTATEKLRLILSPTVMESGLLIKDMTFIPEQGATAESIAELEAALPRPLLPEHRELLTTWNGLSLDVVKILAATDNQERIQSILSAQDWVPAENGNVAFAIDPSGFLYFQSTNGQVWSSDHDGGEITLLASCINAFVSDYLSGAQADRFMGEAWLAKLQQLGLCNEGPNNSFKPNPLRGSA